MIKVFLTDGNVDIFLGECVDEKTCWKEICHPYLEEKGIEYYYVRVWTDEDGRIWNDFGDYTWFFIYVK